MEAVKGVVRLLAEGCDGTVEITIDGVAARVAEALVSGCRLHDVVRRRVVGPAASGNDEYGGHEAEQSASPLSGHGRIVWMAGYCTTNSVKYTPSMAPS